jgi:hypothetical protein
MKVLVKQDSATVTPVDCGEGEAGIAKARELLAQFGSGVTNEDGSALNLPAVTVPKAKKKAAAKKKAGSKAKAKRK